jgi:hypothetical protein
MEQGSGPQTTSVGVTRQGRAATATVSELGPLAALVGTWMGSRGWELITDAETNEPLHLETGMWLLLDDQGTVARQASIPHGDVVLAIGTATTESGAPSIPALSTLPDAGPKTPLGYTDVYLRPVDGFSPGDANEVLRVALVDQKIVKTTTLPVSTDGGGIANIPFVTANANATAFRCAYWIETVEDPITRTQFSQLQYSQQTNLEFLPQFGNPGELIMWPHVNVNTLLKQ